MTEDTKNLKILETYQDGTLKVQVRFKYKDLLTGRTEVHQKWIDRTTIEQARKYRDEKKLEFASPRKTDSLRLSDFIPSYQTRRVLRGKKGKKLRYATLKSEAQVLDYVIEPWVGDWIVEKITRNDCNQLLDSWLMLDKPQTEKQLKAKKPIERYSRWTIKNWWKAFRQLLRFACDELGIVHSPAEGVSGIPTQPKDAVAHTPKEAKALLEDIYENDRFFYPMVLLGYTTSARYSAISALHRNSIDREHGVTKYDTTQYRGVFSEGDKTGRQWWFPNFDFVIDAIDEHLRELFRIQHPGLASGLIFPSNVGKPLWPSRVRDVLDAACERAGVPRITFNNLRDTWNTNAVQGGLQGEVVRSITGHKSEEMTMHYYLPHVEARKTAVAPVVELFQREKQG